MGIFRLSIAVSFLLLTGCQTKEAASGPKIFGSLYVRYLQDGGLLKAEASFFKGDSAQHAKPITILGGVSFQSSGMEHRNIQDKLIRYQYETTVVYPDEFTFQVQDDQGKSHQFQLQMPPVSQFILADTIYLDREMTLELLPAPQSPEEEVAFLFTDQTGKASLLEIPPPISHTLTLMPAQLNRLAPGTYQLYLVKKRKNFVNEGVYRISCEVEYYTEVKEVVIRMPAD
ncbi:MAG: hypothetical protein IPL49_20035 [Saprospirales bacterium]|nr:hypothetical protein [Saprospirales bacterium]